MNRAALIFAAVAFVASETPEEIAPAGIVDETPKEIAPADIVDESPEQGNSSDVHTACRRDVDCRRNGDVTGVCAGSGECECSTGYMVPTTAGGLTLQMCTPVDANLTAELATVWVTATYADGNFSGLDMSTIENYRELVAEAFPLGPVSWIIHAQLEDGGIISYSTVTVSLDSLSDNSPADIRATLLDTTRDDEEVAAIFGEELTVSIDLTAPNCQEPPGVSTMVSMAGICTAVACYEGFRYGEVANICTEIPHDKEHDDSDISAGAAVGIVFAFLACTAVAVAAFLNIRGRRRRKAEEDEKPRLLEALDDNDFHERPGYYSENVGVQAE